MRWMFRWFISSFDSDFMRLRVEGWLRVAFIRCLRLTNFSLRFSLYVKLACAYSYKPVPYSGISSRASVASYYSERNGPCGGLSRNWNCWLMKWLLLTLNRILYSLSPKNTVFLFFVEPQSDQTVKRKVRLQYRYCPLHTRLGEWVHSIIYNALFKRLNSFSSGLGDTPCSIVMSAPVFERLCRGCCCTLHVPPCLSLPPK